MENYKKILLAIELNPETDTLLIDAVKEIATRGGAAKTTK